MNNSKEEKNNHNQREQIKSQDYSKYTLREFFVCFCFVLVIAEPHGFFLLNLYLHVYLYIITYDINEVEKNQGVQLKLNLKKAKLLKSIL